jgi:hypothetical protein
MVEMNFPLLLSRMCCCACKTSPLQRFRKTSLSSLEILASDNSSFGFLLELLLGIVGVCVNISTLYESTVNSATHQSATIEGLFCQPESGIPFSA